MIPDDGSPAEETLIPHVKFKEVRIQKNGRVVSADRKVVLTKGSHKDGPDHVLWRKVTAAGAGSIDTVHFDKSPFVAGSQDIPVPPGQSGPANQPVGTYKYTVLDANGEETDDPDVDIES